MEWLKSVQLFVNVVQQGSFSAAARQAGISPASVSRIINSLEGEIGGRLLNRSSRNLNLTEAGEIYYGQVEPILQQIAEANESVAQLQSAPRGMLRVHSRMVVGDQYVAPALPGFFERHPEVQVDLTMSNFPADLIGQNIDVDIRIGKLQDSSLIARKLANASRIVCATPDYLRQHEPITTPWDLRNHNCLTYRLNFGRSMWRFLDTDGTLIEIPVSGSLQSDNGRALRTAMMSGLGVAMMQDWSVRDQLRSGDLIHLLPEYATSHTDFDNGIYVVFQHRRKMPSKVRVFIDFLAEYFHEHLDQALERPSPEREE